MNISNFLWGLFKYVYLPIGLSIGVLHESDSLVSLSYSMVNMLGSLTHVMFVNGSIGLIVAQIFTAPAALIAWMVPEGSSIVFLLPAAILGQYGIFVVLFACCWMLAPPRFMQAKAVYD